MLKRTLTDNLKRIASNFPVVLLTGPRQVGKTTLLEEFSKGKLNTVSLDDLTEREIAQKDPALFIQNHQPPVIIDEVQYAPQLFTYIKIHVDKHKNQNGLFLLTGSQKFSLMKGIQESLAGRVAIIDMLGLSYKEIIRQPKTSVFLPGDKWLKDAWKQAVHPLTVTGVYTAIWNGSFPRLVMQSNADRDLFYRSYVQTYIERDVKDSHNVSDSITFFNFVKATAARTGQLLNFTDLARDVSIDPKTAKAWLSILELSGLVKLLYPYHNNITKRIVKTPKVYFLDTGLCAYLTGWDGVKSLEAGAMSGAMIETYVYVEILKSYWHNGKEPLIYFYRDKEQKEIDFIIEANGMLYPIEVKKTLIPTMDMAKSFSILGKLKKPIGRGVVLCLKPEVLLLGKNIISVPIWEI